MAVGEKCVEEDGRRKKRKRKILKKIIFYYYNIGPIFDQLRQYPKITKNREYYLEM